MLFNSYLLANTDELRKLIGAFSATLHVNLFFYSGERLLITQQRALTDVTNIDSYFSQLHLDQPTIFPMAIDRQIVGGFVLDAKQATDDQLLMYQGCLSSAGRLLKTDEHHSITILNGMAISSLKSQVDKISASIANKGADYPSQLEDSPKVTADPTLAVEDDQASTNSNVDKNFLQALHYINNNIARPMTLEDVAQQTFVSASYLSRLFKNYFKVNFIDYVNNRKIALACQQISLTAVPISKLAKQLGFSQASYFTKIFKQKCGMTPSQYRTAYPHVQKVYTIPRDLTWLNNQSVYTISQKYFQSQGIDFETHNLNGFLYVYSIDHLRGDVNNGWVYTVNCQQPLTPSTAIKVGDKSVVQWTYTKLNK